MVISIPQDLDFIPLGLPTCPKKLIFHPLQTRMTQKGQARNAGSAQSPCHRSACAMRCPKTGTAPGLC